MGIINRFRNLNSYYRMMYSLVFIFAFTVYLDLRYDDIFRASNAFDSYVSLFWLFAYGLIFGMAYIYYSLTRDKSETFAFVASYFVLLYTGIHDLIFYLVKQQSLPASMPHLFQHPIMGKIASGMGYSTVTPASLIVSVSIGLVSTYYIIKYLKKL